MASEEGTRAPKGQREGAGGERGRDRTTETTWPRESPSLGAPG